MSSRQRMLSISNNAEFVGWPSARAHAVGSVACLSQAPSIKIAMNKSTRIAPPLWHGNQELRELMVKPLISGVVQALPARCARSVADVYFARVNLVGRSTGMIVARLNNQNRFSC